jgi:copper(I)-binding protein
MLTGLKMPLTAGSSIDITLNFAHAGSITVPFAVEAIGATMPMDGAHDHMAH